MLAGKRVKASNYEDSYSIPKKHLADCTDSKRQLSYWPVSYIFKLNGLINQDVSDFFLTITFFNHAVYVLWDSKNLSDALW